MLPAKKTNMSWTTDHLAHVQPAQGIVGKIFSVIQTVDFEKLMNVTRKYEQKFFGESSRWLLKTKAVLISPIEILIQNLITGCLFYAQLRCFVFITFAPRIDKSLDISMHHNANYRLHSLSKHPFCGWESICGTKISRLVLLWSALRYNVLSRCFLLNFSACIFSTSR